MRSIGAVRVFATAPEKPPRAKSIRKSLPAPDMSQLLSDPVDGKVEMLRMLDP